MSDEVEEEAILHRGGVMNGVHLDMWTPGLIRYEGDIAQPELAEEQEELGPEWADVDPATWSISTSNEWVVRQGHGADCSVVAGFGACLEHNRRWGTSVSEHNNRTIKPDHSVGARHVVPSKSILATRHTPQIRQWTTRSQTALERRLAITSHRLLAPSVQTQQTAASRDIPSRISPVGQRIDRPSLDTSHPQRILQSVRRVLPPRIEPCARYIHLDWVDSGTHLPPRWIPARKGVEEDTG